MRTIRTTSQLKVLRMAFQQDKRNSTLITHLKHSTDPHMLRRVIMKRHGFGGQALRLVQAFIISRITYAVPYALLKKREESVHSNNLKTIQARSVRIFPQTQPPPYPFNSASRICRLN
ncbi:hypothetical protein HPB48_014874 [Haemaphysalis longicornis]|uniref:Uncharacterized protein n=1 Tax=Haemaphysalis longicornis TaxID=44386 RepID=A0A9J6FNW9_HAELO|nr:hypothetical protein HPB48_014874 [Haemaphysalis longicornis]